MRNLGTYNPIKICLHEWIGIIKDVRSAKSLREVIGYWLGPPGWSPDGSRDSSKILKERWRKQRAAELDDEADRRVAAQPE